MELIIHRGTQEIGGSCVELKSQGRSLLLDLGMPLVNADLSGFDETKLKGVLAKQLVEQRVLPDIPGLYGNESCNVEAVLLSHSHGDHYGLGGYVRADVPFWMSRGTRETIKISGDFIFGKGGLKNVNVIEEMWKPMRFGPFTVKAHPVDHSAFDALAFEIEADGKKIFYTGDLRAHGRTRKKTDHIISKATRNVDAMLMEGSSLAREDDEYSYNTESDVAKAIIECIEGKDNLAVVYASAQNIDRLMSARGAALHTGRELVIDLYTAALLESWHTEKDSIFQFDEKNIKVLFWPNHMEALQKSNPCLYKRIMRSGHGIKKCNILNNPSRYLVLARANRYYREYILDKLATKENLAMIWSMWRGYWNKDWVKNYVLDFCALHDVELTPIHTSGHATVEDLRRLAQAINPQKLIPIHTFHADKYDQFGVTIKRLKDGESLTL